MRDEIILRKKWLAAWPGSFSLIEPSIGSTPGFPDCVAEIDGLVGLVEFKVEKEGHVLLEATQRLWLLDHIENNKRIAIVALNSRGFYTVPAISVVRKGMPLSLPLPLGAPYLPWEYPDHPRLSFPAHLAAYATEAWGYE